MKKLFGTIRGKDKIVQQPSSLPVSKSGPIADYSIEELNKEPSTAAQLSRNRKSIMLKQSPSLNLIQAKLPNQQLIPQAELEVFCINYAYDTIRNKKLLKNESQEELVAALIVRATYDHVRSLLQVAPEFHVDLVTKHIDHHISKIVARILKAKKQHLQEAKLLVGSSSAYSEKGLREFNEDKHVCLPYMHEYIGDKPTEPHSLSLFGVFDGHGGSACADFVSTHLAINIGRHQNLNRNAQIALHDAFLLTNEQWKDMVLKNGLSETCGTTGVVALFSNRDLYVAWAGDSSALLFLKNGVWLDFIVPHKPSSEQERQRIEGLGGSVINDRVSGILAVSRSFGDLKYGCVIPEPDIVQYRLQGQELFLVLACDGLTDVMSPIDVMETVKRTLAEPGGEHIVAQRLVDAALNKGSTDNVSVIYISLQHVDKPEDFVPVIPSSYKKDDQQNILYKKPTAGSQSNVDGVGIFAKQAEQKYGSVSKLSDKTKHSVQNIVEETDGDVTPPMQPEDFEPEPQMAETVLTDAIPKQLTDPKNAGSSNSVMSKAKPATMVKSGSSTKLTEKVASQDQLKSPPKTVVRNWKDPNVHALSELSALVALSKQFTKEPAPKETQIIFLEQPKPLQELLESTGKPGQEVTQSQDFNEEYVISFSAYDDEAQQSPQKSSNDKINRKTSNNLEDVIASYGSSELQTESVDDVLETYEEVD